MAQYMYHDAGVSEQQQRTMLSYILKQISLGHAQTGVLSGLGVRQTPTASGSVIVGAGTGVSQDTRLAGAAMMSSDQELTIDVLGANPVGALPRTDVIVFDSATLSGGSGGLRLITGVPNASPDAPAIPATACPLARLRHAANAEDVPTSAIDDLRVFTNLFGVEKVADTGWISPVPGISAASGWSISSSHYRKYGPLVSFQINVTRTGGNLGAGNITNFTIVNIPGSLTPAQSNGAVGSGPSGVSWSGYVSAGGGIIITTLEQAINTGDSNNIFVTYLV